MADEDATLADQGNYVGELGRYYHAYRLTEAAEECYRIARRLSPEDFRWHYLLGYLMQSLGRADDAEKAYDAALALHRAAPPALVRLGQVYLMQSRAADAERVLREALQLDPTSAATEAALGELMHSLGRDDEAVRLLESALQKEPDANRLYYALGLAYRGLGDKERAKSLMMRSGKVGVRPADPIIDGLVELTAGERVHLLRGQTAYRAGRYADAVKEFRKAVAAAPTSIAAHIDLGSALGENGQTEAAIEAFEQAVELAPGNATALFNLGVLLLKAGQPAVAAERLYAASQFASDDSGIFHQLGAALRASGRPADAIEQYDKAIELDPPGELSRLGAAGALVELGEFDQARERLEASLEVIPASGLLAHGLSRLLAMAPDEKVRDGERALELASMVYHAQPTADHAFVVAAAYAQVNRCEDAVDWQQKAIDALNTDAAATAQQREILALYEAGPPCPYPFG